VDYCLRLRAAGLRVLWTPYARVTHLESMSRAGTGVSAEAKAAATEEGRHFLAKWGQRALSDPHWNPALSLAAESPFPGTPPVLDLG
jgi:O-antigen biosynthesis protein